MYLLLWLLFGAIIGCLASIITGDNNRLGLIGNIVVGFLGSLIGGLITDWVGIGSIRVFSWQGALFSILGAVILLTFINLFNRRR